MITISGLDETMASLERLNRLHDALVEACRELCEKAEQVVIRRYSLFPESGNDEFETIVEDIPNGCRLVVTGEDIGFLEFGTGIYASADEFADTVDYEVAPGSWSDLHSQQFREGHWYWYFRGEATEGMPPTRGMHQAYEEIANSIDEVVKRKIEEWTQGN